MSMQQGVLSELVSTDVDATKSIIPASKYRCRCNIIQGLLSEVVSTNANSTKTVVRAS